MLTKIFDFFFHRHKWKIIQKGQVHKKGIINGHYFYLQCEKCGCLIDKEF